VVSIRRVRAGAEAVMVESGEWRRSMNAFGFPCKTPGCDGWVVVQPEEMPGGKNIRRKCHGCQQEHDYSFSEKIILNEIPCKRDGCKHPLSVHSMRRAEKRPSVEEGRYNIHSDKTDGDACSEPGCDCFAYLSYA
jgi:hypothetical protein